MRKKKARCKKVSKEEFDTFISEYPEPLGVGSIDVTNFKTVTYHDHSYGRYPDNLAAFSVEESGGTEYFVYTFKIIED